MALYGWATSGAGLDIKIFSSIAVYMDPTIVTLPVYLCSYGRASVVELLGASGVYSATEIVHGQQ